MGFSIDMQIPVFTVFVQGLLSFFSPCVLPLIPLYVGYLSGGTMKREENGTIIYKKSTVMLNTICFVFGTSVTFFLLAVGVSSIGSLLGPYQYWITRISGVAVILLGLYQIGILGNSRLLGNTRRLPFQMDKLTMSPITAFFMGFCFSFAWTPCVGPAMTSVILMAVSVEKQMMGYILIGVYTLGLVLPFIMVGLFTTKVLNFFKSHMNIIKYTVKIGGIMMIVMGILMFTGKMNSFSDYLSEESKEEITQQSEDKTDEDIEVNAPDFTLEDQYGNSHTLSEYQGKTVFLNFWATWCGPCRSEMPDIQELFEFYDSQEVIILGIAAPGYGKEGTAEEIKEFLEENGYTYPVLMDTTGELFSTYGISAYPTTFMIRPDGNIEGYVTGAISKEIMENIIEQTKNSGEE